MMIFFSIIAEDVSIKMISLLIRVNLSYLKRRVMLTLSKGFTGWKSVDGLIFNL